MIKCGFINEALLSKKKPHTDEASFLIKIKGTFINLK